jgi:hypothetical protein
MYLDLAHFITFTHLDFDINRNGLGMATCVKSGYGRLRDSSLEITKALEHVAEGAGKFTKLQIVETATYQPRPNCCLFARWQVGRRG